MELKQKLELRKLLVPELTQSLKILTMPLLDLRNFVENELETNPLLEEIKPKEDSKTVSTDEIIEQVNKSLTDPNSPDDYRYSEPRITTGGADLDFRLSLITKKASLQEVLLRQLGMFANSDEELIIGQEIIGNLDENGYLKAPLEEIASALNLPLEKAESSLKLIQQFDPAGVGARTPAECLLIQLELSGDKDPLIRKIVEFHLEDLAKKKYGLIAKSLKETPQQIDCLIKKILKLNPKPGLNYSTDEIQHVIPDIMIHEKGDDLEILINNEDIPNLVISKEYRDMLKNTNTDPATKEFLTQKLRNAIELLRAISRRQTTLRKVLETIVEIQQEALQKGFAYLKPLNFKEVAQKINMHETTVCRVVMNKYALTPYGVVALKDFFASHVHDKNGQSISSTSVKRSIKELIENEDKKQPLSDQDISTILSREKNLNVPRRTVTKYREKLRILSSTYRRER